MSSRESSSVQPGLSRYVRPAAISLVTGILVCAVILLLFSLVLSTQNIPQSAIDPMATAAVASGALVAGYVCSRQIRRNGLLCGLVCGVILSFVLLLASLGVSDYGFGIPALFKVVFILLLSMIGGVLGVNRKQKRGAAKAEKPKSRARR